MKRKITRATIDEIRKKMPLLTEPEMRCCNGGDNGTVSWDCLFNCMHAMNPSRSAQDYAAEYMDRYNWDPVAMGGVPPNYISDVLTSLGFNNVSTDSLINNREYEQVVTIINPDGTAHAVIALSLPDENGNFIYKDPTTNEKYVRGEEANIAGIYRIKKSEIDTSGNGGYRKDNGYECNYSIYTDADNYTNGYNYNYDYNNYEYYGDDQNDYNGYNYYNF